MWSVRCKAITEMRTVKRCGLTVSELSPPTTSIIASTHDNSSRCTSLWNVYRTD